ncbi:hypothetical protein, partial [Candidatus Ichthyocystis hellenicum]|uniref:hypothetical protein n=1 Tax=Candidatus Ichthyocystis hellenicum TaxID=1561003 RepID=UPI001585BDC9
LLICDDYGDICFHTQNHTALDVYSAAKLKLSASGLESCHHASEVCVDYAIFPSALTLEEQVNLKQGTS